MLQKLQHVHGYDVLECRTEDRKDLADGSGRADKREVLILDRLCAAAVALNPDIPADRIDYAVEQIAARRATLAPVAANAEVHLLCDGIPSSSTTPRAAAATNTCAWWTSPIPPIRTTAPTPYLISGYD